MVDVPWMEGLTVLQTDLWEHERLLEAWCPEEHQARMRFAMTECGSTEWSGGRPCSHGAPCSLVDG